MSDEPTDGELRVVNYIVGEAESGQPIFNHRLEQYYSGEWRAVRVYHEGSGANLSEVPEGRKPLPDEWFSERAQMQERIEELESKLAKAVGLLEAWVNVAAHCTIEEGVCCCGDNMDTHDEPMDCGHCPVDHGAYVASRLVDDTSDTLAELTGGKDE